jgi:tight adherence protein B
MMPLLIGILAFCSIALLAFAVLRLVAPLNTLTSLKKIEVPLDEGLTPSEIQLLRDRRLSHHRTIDRFLRNFKLAFRIQLAIAQSGVRVMTDTVVALCFASAIFVFSLSLLMGLPGFFAAGLGVAGLFFPFFYLAYKKYHRLTLIEAELPDALDSIARAMQAGNSFPGALSVVGRDTPDPLGAEIRLVSEEINFGRSTREGLIALGERVDSLDVRYFVVAVLIHTQTGGNLTELLKSLSALIRDRHRLRKLGSALSAEGRLSAWILILMPFATAVLIHLVNPEFMSILWTDPAGLLAIQIMLVLMVIGSAWIWRIVHFRI